MPPDEPPFDDPPRPRRTPRTPAPGSLGVPRPSRPDLFEAFEAFLQEYGTERADGISNRAILAYLEKLSGGLTVISERLAKIEGGNQVRDTFSAGGTGRFTVDPHRAPSPLPPPPPKSSPNFVTKLGTVFVEQVSKYLVPMLAAGAAGWLAAHGCRP